MTDFPNRRTALAGAAALFSAACLPRAAMALDVFQPPDPAYAVIAAYDAALAFYEGTAEFWMECPDMLEAAQGLGKVVPTTIAGAAALVEAILQWEGDWANDPPVSVTFLPNMLAFVHAREGVA